MNIHTDGKKIFKIIFMVLLSLAPTGLSGCISNETQEVGITGDMGYSVGAINENQTNIQKITWTASIVNNGKTIAKNVSCKAILHPEVSSSLIALEGNTTHIGNLKPDTWEGFKGIATFNASNISKHDIDKWGNLIKIKVTWEENGERVEKTIPEVRK